MSQLLPSVIHQLTKVYSVEEARAVSKRLLSEPPLNLSQMTVFTGGEEDLSESEKVMLENMLKRLLAGEPLQYVLGHEYFCGLPMAVGPGVLIPRPETQDLVEWVALEQKDKASLTIMDACTGSGCIAAALANMLPQAHVIGVDVSPLALKYAKENTLPFASRVEVQMCDLLNQKWNGPCLDVLVSNPPYIADEERSDMDNNVKKYEPDIALFVPNDDPLKFYRQLGILGQQYLHAGGAIYVEINRRFSKETCALFMSLGYHEVECRLDRFGEPRMVKAVKK